MRTNLSISLSDVRETHVRSYLILRGGLRGIWLNKSKQQPPPLSHLSSPFLRVHDNTLDTNDGLPIKRTVWTLHHSHREECCKSNVWDAICPSGRCGLWFMLGDWGGRGASIIGTVYPNVLKEGSNVCTNATK